MSGGGRNLQPCGTPATEEWINTSVAERLGLTQRLCDVLCGIADGMTNDAIASALGLTSNTVKMHVGRLARALGATDRAHAVALAYDKGALRTAAERARLARQVAA